MTFEPVVMNVKKLSLPFFYRMASLAILLEGLFGVILFFSVLGYSLYDNSFVSWGYGAFYGDSFYLLILLQLTIYSGILLSGILLLSQKLAGFYMFTLSYLVLFIMDFFVHHEFSVTGAIIGMVMWLILFVNFKNLK